MKNILRKATLIITCIVLILSTGIAAHAEPEVIFTSDSGFTAGETVKVDEVKTKQSIMDRGKNADEYNAALEGNMRYSWFRNDSYYKDGTFITLTKDDKGCQFYCKVYLFSDADCTQQCGVYDSAKFTVPNSNPAQLPEIRDESIPDGRVGAEYYVKLDCSDPDAVFSLFRSSLPDGLNLTQHGEIEGTPTKAGFWHVVIMVTPEEGEDYANTKEFEITISEEGSDYTLEIEKLPNKIIYTAGEKLDMTGLKVRIYTPDGFIDYRDGKYLTYSQKEIVTVGEQKIKISYEDAFEFFIVTVKAAPTTQPTTAPTDEPTVAPTAEPTTRPTADDPGSESSATPAPTTPAGDVDDNGGSLWWIWIVIAAVAVCGVVLFIVFGKKKKEQ